MKLFRTLSISSVAFLLAGCSSGDNVIGTVPTISVGLMTVPEVTLVVSDPKVAECDTLRLSAADVDSCMTISSPAGGNIRVVDVTIGVGFHWEQQETQAFEGDIRLLRKGNDLVVINDID
ncbi:MAG: hypothetical protein K2J07_06355, partial [Muribaculaceae bacterium]|nr:hypothetical protein [Muribaculaceae bacterium]